MKILLGCVCLFMATGSFALAQVKENVVSKPVNQQISVQLGAAFTRKTTDKGVTYNPTTSGSGLVSYRYSFIRWFGVEADYGFMRDSQKFSSALTSAEIKTDVHALTGSAVFSFSNPLTKKMQSFMTIGGGELLFQPDNATGVASQRKSAIAIGGGDDFLLSRHLALRLQIQSYLYKPPVFPSTGLASNKYATTISPSFGLVYKF